MPKISTSDNRIKIHVGNLWKKKKQMEEFKVKDIGRVGYSQIILCRYKGKWQTYAWSFLKSQVSKSGRTLICKDKNAYDILSKMKEGGDLKGYKVDYVVPHSKMYRQSW